MGWSMFVDQQKGPWSVVFMVISYISISSSVHVIINIVYVIIVSNNIINISIIMIVLVVVVVVIITVV